MFLFSRIVQKLNNLKDFCSNESLAGSENSLPPQKSVISKENKSTNFTSSLRQSFSLVNVLEKNTLEKKKKDYERFFAFEESLRDQTQAENIESEPEDYPYLNALFAHGPLPLVLQETPLWSRSDADKEILKVIEDSKLKKAPKRDDEVLHTQIVGNGPEAVIMLHGMCMSSGFWTGGPIKHIPSEYFSRYTFYCPDLLGYGKSKEITSYSNYSIEEQATLVIKDVIQRYHLTNYHLMGHSFGCLVCLDIASRNVESIGTILFFSPAYFESEKKAYQILTSIPFPVSHTVAYPELGRLMISSLNSLRPWLAPIAQRIIPGTELPELSLLEFFSIDPHSTLSTVKTIVHDRVDHFLEQLFTNHIRIFVVHGDNDGVVPINQARLLATRYPNIILRILAGKVHHFPVSNAKLAASIIIHELLSFESRNTYHTWRV